MKYWYLIYTKPKSEQTAKEHLERQGYSIYLPMAVVRRKRRGRSVSVIEAMFPRYLFIQLSEQTDDWGPIRSTIGVSTLVRFGQIPVKIPNTLISSLCEREDSDGIQILPQKDHQKGDWVRIAEGPLEGYEGLFQCKTGKERAILLLQIVEKSVNVEVDTSQIETI
jgi:transcriptional antiterminator RfaH